MVNDVTVDVIMKSPSGMNIVKGLYFVHQEMISDNSLKVTKLYSNLKKKIRIRFNGNY